MREFMNELGKKVNEVTAQIGKKTEPLMKKTEEMVEVQKLKSQIRTLDRNNDLDLCDLGEIIFAKYLGGLVKDEEVIAICEGIQQRLDAIEEIDKKVSELQGVESCPECEMKVDKTATFCANCGAKLDFQAVQEEVVEEEAVEEEAVEVEVEEAAEVEVEEAAEAAEVEAEIEDVLEVSEIFELE